MLSMGKKLSKRAEHALTIELVCFVSILMTLLKFGAPGHRRAYTAKACAAHPGAVYPTEACVVSGCVYTVTTPQRHVFHFHIDVSTL